MADTIDQTEHAAAELLALGFQQSWKGEGGKGASAPPAEGDTPRLNSPLSMPARLAPITTSQTPSGRTSSQAQQPHTSAGHAPPSRSRNPVSPRPRGSRGLLPSVGGTGPTGVHPVVRLGWKSLCSVVCNGLHGEFLGGHDRDMFIQVTSSHYAGLPLVDVSLGGCIMTCSQFERCAGRELSKKWKESIHVVGEGEGSRATLLSWLKRKAEQDYGAGVIGKKVWVCWCADAEYYQGTIVSYNRDGGKHTVQYSSRLAEDLHLPVELISFDVDKPILPPPSVGPAASAPAAVRDAAGGAAAGTATVTTGGETDAAAIGVNEMQINSGAVGTAAAAAGGSPSPLWHQGSGISVTSSYGEELRGNAALAAMASGARGGLRSGSRSRRSKATVRAAAEAPSDMPPPKRTVSAPPAVLLAEAAAAAAAMEEEKKVTGGGAAAAPAVPAAGTSSPLTPGRPLSHHAAAFGPLEAALVTALPALLLPLPPPPPGAAADTPEARAAAVGWMHDVALCLDGELTAAERFASSPGTPPLSLAQQQQHQQPSPLQTSNPAQTGSPDNIATTTTAGAAGSPPLPTANIFLVSSGSTSPSGRFQALLGLLRGSPACLDGIYEGMVRRFNYFRTNPAFQRRKMVELVLSTLAEAAAPRDLFKGAVPGGSSPPSQSPSPSFSLPNIKVT